MATNGFDKLPDCQLRLLAPCRPPPPAHPPRGSRRRPRRRRRAPPRRRPHEDAEVERALLTGGPGPVARRSGHAASRTQEARQEAQDVRAIRPWRAGSRARGHLRRRGLGRERRGGAPVGTLAARTSLPATRCATPARPRTARRDPARLRARARRAGSTRAASTSPRTAAHEPVGAAAKQGLQRELAEAKRRGNRKVGCQHSSAASFAAGTHVPRLLAAEGIDRDELTGQALRRCGPRPRTRARRRGPAPAELLGQPGAGEVRLSTSWRSHR